MNELKIVVSGQVQESNFLAFKDHFVAEIKKADRALKTDQNFAEAVEQVDRFKVAEKMLQEAKTAALNETADIRDLFQAIDDLSAELKTTRLSLDKQIKSEKEKRKKEVVDNGIAEAKELVGNFTKETPAIGFLYSLDASRFDAAVKGRQKVDTMKAAVSVLIGSITDELKALAEKAEKNTAILAEAGDEYSTLFPDRKELLNMDETTLRATVEQRIANYKLDQERKAEAEEKKNWTAPAPQKVVNDEDGVPGEVVPGGIFVPPTGENQDDNGNTGGGPDENPEPVSPSAFDDVPPAPDTGFVKKYIMTVIINATPIRVREIADELDAVVGKIDEVESVLIKPLEG